MTTAPAPAKINLALVVGPLRPDGKHELLTVFQRLDLADAITVEPAEQLAVDGFASDTIVRSALEALAEAVGIAPAWRVRIEKRIPVAGGLGGGSSDAATALRLANGLLQRPLPDAELHRIAARIGADVPFFLEPGPQLGRGDGSELEPVRLPVDYAVLLLLPHGEEKRSTGSVYRAFDERDGARGFAERRGALLDALARVGRPADLAALPRNDLASSPHAAALEELGAVRADVSGAGPTVYALFESEAGARRAEPAARAAGATWICKPSWYG